MKSPVLAFKQSDLPPTRDTHFVRGAALALLEQYGMAPPDPSSNLRGFSVKEIAEQAALRAGLDLHGASSAFKVNGLQTQSDFPNVLATLAIEIVRAGWDAGPLAWQRLCGVSSLRNFKSMQTLYVGGLGVLPKLNEGQPVPARSVPSYLSNSKVDAYGIKFILSREAQLNNDLTAFIADGKSIGYAAAASVEAGVFSVLASNPTLVDSGQLFNATASNQAGGHANRALVDVDLSGTALALGKGAMRRQTASANERPLNIRPRFLVASAELEEDAWSIAGLPNGFGEAGSDVERYMIQSGRVEPITTPYLTGNGWYLFADPLVAPLINVAFLHGKTTPTVVSQTSFDSEAFESIARLDFGAGAADFRGGYFNAGGS
jgi:hypothetical protein